MTIGWYINAIDDLLGGIGGCCRLVALLLAQHLLLCGHLIQLQAEGEAQLLEFIVTCSQGQP